MIAYLQIDRRTVIAVLTGPAQKQQPRASTQFHGGALLPRDQNMTG